MVLVVGLLLCTVLLLVVTSVEVQRWQFSMAAGVALVAVAVAAYVFIVRPLLREPSDRRLAMFIEERVPALQDRLNSAVEVGSLTSRASQVSQGHDTVYDQIVLDAITHARDIQPSAVVDKRRDMTFGIAATLLLAAFLVFGYRVKDHVKISRAGVNIVGVSFAEPVFTIFPGNGEVERGASQEFIVRVGDDRGEDVTLVARLGEGEWQQLDMARGIDEKPTYLAEIHDIQEGIEYYVQRGDTRSEVFRLALYEFPAVEQIDLTYRYPAYTGLGPSEKENAGDIEAVIGTVVDLSVAVGGRPTSGALVQDDGSRTELAMRDDGKFAGRIPVNRDGSYHIELLDESGKGNRFPVEYAIIAYDDLPPVVTVLDPARDIRANAIQEVLIAAEARDDFGTASIALRFSVNGEPEQEINLAPDIEAGALAAAGEHLVFLEDHSLEPGDVISYYVEATDRRPNAQPSATDMYFIEVIPFDQQFTQVNNMGGAGGGGRQGGIVLSQQEIIAATWRLHRERFESDEAELTELTNGIISAQENLKSNIEERITTTAFSRELMEDEESRQVVEHLRNATKEMTNAVAVLRTGDLNKALTPERRALNHLLKADALNTEQQVTAGRGNSGGGGGGSTQERISELMDLELDISRDKYETQQQRAQQQQANEADDALDRIKELARRQQQLADEGREQETEGEDKKRFVDRLQREQDELRRQTDELARSLSQSASDAEGSNGAAARAREGSERVSSEMEKAEEALRRGDVEEAMTHQQRAVNELQRLQRDLQVSSIDATRSEVAGVARAFDELSQEEGELSDAIEAEARRIEESGGSVARNANRETLEALERRREANLERLRGFVEQIEEAEPDLREDDPAAASALRSMLQRMRREEIGQNMENSAEALRQGWLDYAARTQDEILSTLERLERDRRSLDRSLPPDESEQLARSMRDADELQRAIDNLRRDAEAGGEPGEGGEPRDGRSGEGDQAGDGDSGGDREDRTRAARRQRDIERAREALARLRDGLLDNTASGDGTRQQLDRLESFLSSADSRGFRLEGEEADAYFDREAYDPLSQLELHLAGQLDQIELERKLYGAREADVPPEYRRLIDAYYEGLSRTGEQRVNQPDN